MFDYLVFSSMYNVHSCYVDLDVQGKKCRIFIYVMALTISTSHLFNPY